MFETMTAVMVGSVPQFSRPMRLKEFAHGFDLSGSVALPLSRSAPQTYPGVYFNEAVCLQYLLVI
jgi:hypothetical protein